MTLCIWHGALRHSSCKLNNKSSACHGNRSDMECPACTRSLSQHVGKKGQGTTRGHEAAQSPAFRSTVWNNSKSSMLGTLWHTVSTRCAAVPNEAKEATHWLNDIKLLCQPSTLYSATIKSLWQTINSLVNALTRRRGSTLNDTAGGPVSDLSLRALFHLGYLYSLAPLRACCQAASRLHD